MGKMIKLADAREMSVTKVQTEIGKCVMQLEKLGMDHIESCELIGTIMNLGIAMNEKKPNK